MSNYVFLLLVLACPLMMVWMMRGGNGHAGDAHSHGDGSASTDDLRRRRDELDRQIAARERPHEGGGDAALTET